MRADRIASFIDDWTTGGDGETTRELLVDVPTDEENVYQRYRVALIHCTTQDGVWHFGLTLGERV